MTQSINPLSTHEASGDPVQAVETMGCTKTGRLKMFVIFAICAMPVIGSYVAYYVVKPTTTKSYGELIAPLKAMPDVAAKKLDGTPVTLASLKNQWLLVSSSSGACEMSCEATLKLQRQLREMMGREKDRLDWVWLVNDEVAIKPELAQGLSTLQTQANSGFAALRVESSAVQAWLGDAGQYLYLVDPMGNYMMRFNADISNADAVKIKRDIERVLRASQSWDKPSR